MKKDLVAPHASLALGAGPCNEAVPAPHGPHASLALGAGPCNEAVPGA